MANNIHYIAKYQKENTVQVNFRLNKKYDADIIEFLNGLEGLDDTGKATLIKQLIREDMGCECFVREEDVEARDSEEELFTIEEVAASIGTSIERIERWYRWKSEHPEHEYAKLIPGYVRKGPHGQRYWYESAVAELYCFKSYTPKSSGGNKGTGAQGYEDDCNDEAA